MSANSPSPSPNCHRTTSEIFEVAYDYSVEPLTTRALSGEGLSDRQHAALAMLDFLHEVYVVAPKQLMSYLLCCLWMSIAPACSLYLTNVVLDMVSPS